MPIDPTDQAPVNITVSDAPVRIALADESPVSVALAESPMSVIVTASPVNITSPVDQVRAVEIGTLIQPVYEGDGGRTAVVTFMADEWTLAAGEYYLDLTHALESENAVLLRVAAASGDDIVAFTAVENYTANKIRCRVPADPDGRFGGTAVIMGI